MTELQRQLTRIGGPSSDRGQWLNGVAERAIGIGSTTLVERCGVSSVSAGFERRPVGDVSSPPAASLAVAVVAQPGPSLEPRHLA